MLRIFLILLTFNVQAYMSDFYLFELMMTSYEQLKELNGIIREGKELNKNFQKIMQQVDQSVYKADRVIMWSEDMRDFIENDPKSIDEYLSMLHVLKNEKQELERSYREILVQNKNDKRVKKFYEKQKIRESAQLFKQQSELPSTISSDKAQIKTANNTKEILIQQTKLNMKQNDTNILLK